ncbi:DNA-binding PadR family transcriptional regulator [Spinactinospora alkalitolerans]|uniref:DNA-binding PadR family transcriptional regulator n=1 Tax=Spinactinospora alkalitolerans TaxID=687207 RepID=A0A852U1C7_9ACTN|nr:PadR family transcriptional regulator [Spinactinospora alkalitolerans]NYE50656.1 DNA-binding PadR family transcriptional regulator [Spinactinospora alkalitolerans]
MSAHRARVLELAVLGLLHEGPMHGYELRKRLNSELGAFRAFSYGSLYPCLKGMLRREHVSVAPACAGSPRGRSRIVYRLTAAGHDHLDRLLSEVAPAAADDECFGVHFTLFGHTRGDVRLHILEGRRNRLRERLERLRERLASAPEHADAYAFELHRHGAESVEREIRWLNELIRRERRCSGTGAGADPDAGSEDGTGFRPSDQSAV